MKLDEIGLKHKTDKSSMKERWKDIQGYEGLYQISSFGNVRALCVEKYRGRFKHRRPEKLLCLKKHRDGYLVVSLSKNKQKYFQAHRLVAIAFIKNPENKPFVNHKNGIKNDNFYLNLEWCTSSENAIHSVKLGMTIPTKGEINGMSKLKDSQVKAIYLSSKSHSMLSKKYNIARSSIWKIKTGIAWKHITKKLQKA